MFHVTKIKIGKESDFATTSKNSKYQLQLQTLAPTQPMKSNINIIHKQNNSNNNAITSISNVTILTKRITISFSLQTPPAVMFPQTYHCHPCLQLRQHHSYHHNATTSLQIAYPNPQRKIHRTNTKWWIATSNPLLKNLMRHKGAMSRRMKWKRRSIYQDHKRF